jgi:uncharacterized alkaline shock family protein YloU
MVCDIMTLSFKKEVVMKFSNDSNVETTHKGYVFYNKSILLSIINLAAKEIAGVSRLNNSFASKISKLFSNNFYEGVKIVPVKDSLAIHIYLNVYYGVKVSDVVYKVQESVKNGILAMIDVKLHSINVHVLGVDFKKED